MITRANKGAAFTTVHRSLRDKDHPYVMISVAAAKDATLSMAARGLLLWMMSNFDNWVFNFDHMARTVSVKNGRDAVRNAFRELEQAGYVETKAVRAKNGTFGRKYIFVTDQPGVERTNHPEENDDEELVDAEVSDAEIANMME